MQNAGHIVLCAGNFLARKVVVCIRFTDIVISKGTSFLALELSLECAGLNLLPGFRSKELLALVTRCLGYLNPLRAGWTDACCCRRCVLRCVSSLGIEYSAVHSFMLLVCLNTG